MVGITPVVPTAAGPRAHITRRDLGAAHRVTGEGVAGPRGDHHLVAQERDRGDIVAGRPDGSHRHVGRSRQQQARQLLDRSHAELHLEVVGTRREQVDQARCGVLGEQAGAGQAQHPAAVAGLADLAHRAVLEAEDLDRPARQPQAPRA